MLLVLLILIVVTSFLQPILPEALQGGLYALSLSTKEAILFFLPVVIFSMIFKASVQLAKRASKVMLILFLAIFVSNFISILLGGTVGQVVYMFTGELPLPDTIEALEPLWQFSLPRFVGTKSAMVAGLVGGMVMRILAPLTAEKWATKLDLFARKCLKAILICVPQLILGFFVKMLYDGVLLYMVQQYGMIVSVIILSALTYILTIYLIVHEFEWKRIRANIKDLFPALALGFGTMSGAAALPLSLQALEKYSKDPELTRSVAAITVNIHLIGTCFAIPIFAFAMMKSFGLPGPTLGAYLIFAFYFVLAKFSVSAVPGGGILVLLSVLENCFGFNGAMISFMTTLCLLFDPISTVLNILGNGGFAMVIDKTLDTEKAPAA